MKANASSKQSTATSSDVEAVPVKASFFETKWVEFNQQMFLYHLGIICSESSIVVLPDRDKVSIIAVNLRDHPANIRSIKAAISSLFMEGSNYKLLVTYAGKKKPLNIIFCDAKEMLLLIAKSQVVGEPVPIWFLNPTVEHLAVKYASMTLIWDKPTLNSLASASQFYSGFEQTSTKQLVYMVLKFWRLRNNSLTYKQRFSISLYFIKMQRQFKMLTLKECNNRLNPTYITIN